MLAAVNVSGRICISAISSNSLAQGWSPLFEFYRLRPCRSTCAQRAQGGGARRLPSASAGDFSTEP